MATPDMRRNPPDGAYWAADNGRYASPSTYTNERYFRFLRAKARYLDRCLFATAPDEWGDGAKTLELSIPVLPQLRELGYPAALVLQDGMTPDQIPWEMLDAVFIGGSDGWRHSSELEALTSEAKARGLWIHAGRVNSWKRMDWARSIGCHSVDGTILRFDPAAPVEEWMARAHREPHIWHDADDGQAQGSRLLAKVESRAPSLPGEGEAESQGQTGPAGQELEPQGA